MHGSCAASVLERLAKRSLKAMASAILASPSAEVAAVAELLLLLGPLPVVASAAAFANDVLRSANGGLTSLPPLGVSATLAPQNVQTPLLSA